MTAVGWKCGDLLGKGAFGEVFVAIPNDSTLPLMAVKSAPANEASSLVSEFDILSKFRNVPGIIQCLGEDVSDDGLPSGEMTYNLFLEYAAEGSLSDIIDYYGATGIPEKYVKVFTLSLLEALFSVHSAGYTHCDIKPDNVLVFHDAEDAGMCHVKIADFGLAMETPTESSGNFRGTVRYLPPEVIVSGKVSPAMDIWALGCTVVEMLTGKLPFSKLKDNKQVMGRIANGGQPEIPDWLSEEGKDFLSKCFVRGSAFRLPAHKLLSHPFATGRSLEKRQRTMPQVQQQLPKKQELHQIFERALAVLRC